MVGMINPVLGMFKVLPPGPPGSLPPGLDELERMRLSGLRYELDAFATKGRCERG